MGRIPIIGTSHKCVQVRVITFGPSPAFLTSSEVAGCVGLGGTSLKMKKDLWQQHKSEIHEITLAAKIKFFCHPLRLVLSRWGYLFWTETVDSDIGLGAESLNPAISFYKSLRLTRPFGDFSSRAMPAILGEMPHFVRIADTKARVHEKSRWRQACFMITPAVLNSADCQDEAIAKLGKSMRLVYRRERNLYEIIFLSTQMNQLATRASLGEDSQSCL